MIRATVVDGVVVAVVVTIVVDGVGVVADGVSELTAVSELMG